MSLTWKTQRPSAAGWYWARTLRGAQEVLEVVASREGLTVGIARTPLRFCTHTAWAGPIARPKEPSKAQLATVRYKLDGANLPPSTGGWGQYEWDLVPKAEMLRRARLHLCGGEDILGQPWPADSQWVTLITSVKRNGRWATAAADRFTKENIDAAIAACTPKAAEVAAA